MDAAQAQSAFASASLTYVDARLVQMQMQCSEQSTSNRSLTVNGDDVEALWLGEEFHNPPVIFHPSPLSVPPALPSLLPQSHEQEIAQSQSLRSNQPLPIAIDDMSHSHSHSHSHCESSSIISSNAGIIQFAQRVPAPIQSPPAYQPRLVHLKVDTDLTAIRFDEDEILPFTPGTPEKMKGYSTTTSPTQQPPNGKGASTPQTPWTAILTPTPRDHPFFSPIATAQHSPIEEAYDGIEIDTEAKAHRKVVADNDTFGQAASQGYVDPGFEVTEGLERLVQRTGRIAQARRGSTQSECQQTSSGNST